jgi:hypothetical protein
MLKIHNSKQTTSQSRPLPKAKVKESSLTVMEAIRKIEDAVPKFKGQICEGDIVSDPKTLEEKLDFLLDALGFLKEQKDFISISMLLSRDNLLCLLNSPDAFYCWQVNSLLHNTRSNVIREALLSSYFECYSQNIYWKPFLKEISKYEELSQLDMIFFEGELDNYIKRFTEDVVTIDYARYHIGLFDDERMDYAKFVSCKDIRVKDNEERNLFYTDAEGVIYLPSFVDLFSTKEENLSNYFISVVHECGHHRWNTFEINVHPEVLDYESFGIEYLTYDELTRTMRLRKAGESDEYEISELSGLCALVEFPNLLHTLHNIIDDSRVDRNNMDEFLGLADEYEVDIRRLFDLKKAADDEIPGISALIRAVHEYVYFKETKEDLTEEMKERFGRIEEILNQEGENSSTDSLNKAIRIYRVLEDDAKKHAEQCKGMKVGSGRHGSTTLIKGIVKIVEKPPEMEGSSTSGGTINPSDGNKREGGKGPVDTQKENPRNEQGDRIVAMEEYDEWVDRGYKRKQLKVFEIIAEEGDRIEISKAEKDRIRRVFEKFAPKQGIYERGLDEGEVDAELFAEWFESYQAGRIEEKRYFSRVVYEERDVASAILIDFSGSMHCVLPDVLRAASLIAEVSQVLKDPLLVAGLNEGEGSEFYIIKDWHQADVRLASYGGGATPLAGPMRHLIHKMGKRGIKEKGFKQVFVFTDGEANVGEQPVEDMRMAVKEAWSKQRIKTFMIGIAWDKAHKKRIESFLEKIVGKGNYLILLTSELGRLSIYFERYYKKLVNKLM